MIGIIADDLTGCGDVGLHFADCGLKTVIKVVQDEEEIPEQVSPDVLIINTNSRFDKPEAAYDKVRSACNALKSLEVEKVYKKIDSTLRGNLGSEIDALFDEYDIEALPLCAAFPSMGRTTVKGHHYVGGKLITQTEFANDPRNPVKESHIPTLLNEQTRNADFIMVCNAENDKDVKKFAGEITKSNLSIVVGAAGLAREMVEAWTGRKPEKSAGKAAIKCSANGHPVLLVSGSRNQVTYGQIAELKNISDIMFIPIDFSQNKVKISNWMDDDSNAGPERFEGKSMAIYAENTSGETSPDSVMSVLSRLAARLCEDRLFKNIILCGGDTALNVCRELSIDALRIEHSIMPGVAFCRDVEEKYNILLKPGSFGDEHALAKCFKWFKGNTRNKEKNNKAAKM